MGYNKRKSSSFSIFSFFKACCSSSQEDHYWDSEGYNTARSRIYSSDYDRGRYFAEPGIDRRASDFIAKFHESRVSDPEWQRVAAA